MCNAGEHLNSTFDVRKRTTLTAHSRLASLFQSTIEDCTCFPESEELVRWFASPHLPLALPPCVGRPCTCAMPHTRGGEMRESETRLRNARRACTCFPESDDTCAPVRVATSRVDPPATRWDGTLAPCHTRGRETQGGQTACAVALALSDILADCAQQPAHPRRCFWMVEKRSRRPPAPLASVVADSGAASAFPGWPKFFTRATGASTDATKEIVQHQSIDDD